jgi:hypothetical protein
MRLPPTGPESFASPSGQSGLREFSKSAGVINAPAARITSFARTSNHCPRNEHLIRIACRLYVNEPFGADLKNTVYALDSTTIGLCVALFPWARKLTGHY